MEKANRRARRACRRAVKSQVNSMFSNEGHQGHVISSVSEGPSAVRKQSSTFRFSDGLSSLFSYVPILLQAMFWIIIVLVFLNTCVLATEHYRQPAWLDDFQEITNLFFVILFTVEMGIKMYSLGFQVSKRRPRVSYVSLKHMSYNHVG